MKNAELKVVRFDSNDIIATSLLTVSGLWDNEADNVKGLSGHESDLFFVGTATNANRNKTWKFSGSGFTGGTLSFVDVVNPESSADYGKYNGTYEYHEAGGTGASEADLVYEKSGWYKITQ